MFTVSTLPVALYSVLIGSMQQFVFGYYYSGLFSA